MDMTKKLTKALIEMYWERKCLWQIKSEEYKHRGLKKKAYSEIVTFLRRNGVHNASPKSVRDKIQNLRRAMRKEKKRIDDSDGDYSPTLWYYDLLTFVNDPYTASKSHDKIESFAHLDADDETFTDDIDTLTPTPGNHRKDTEPKNRMLNNHYDESERSNTRKLDEQEAMGINFAAKLKRMETNQQIFAELLMNKVIAKGLLGQLNETTEIVDIISEGPALTRFNNSMHGVSSSYEPKDNNDH